MKDKRQRVALAWPYGLTADPAFYAYLVNAAAAAASLSQYSYAPHHAANQQSSPPFNYAAAGSSAMPRGYSFPPPASHLAAQLPFPVGLAAAAAAAVARTPGSQPTSSNAATLQPETVPPSVTSPDFFPAFLQYRSSCLPPLTRTSLSPVGVAQPSREHRASSTLFQPYKSDDDDKQLWLTSSQLACCCSCKCVNLAYYRPTCLNSL